MATKVKTKKTTEKVEEFYGVFAPILESLQEGQSKPPWALAKIRGDFAECDVWNKNDRFYSTKVYEEAMRDVKESGALGRGQITGQVEHPKTPDDASIRKVAVKYTDLFIRVDEITNRKFAAYEGYVIDNEEGQHLHSLLEAGVFVGMSTRGGAKMHKGKVGNDTKEGTIIDLFKLKAIDPVGDPSNESGFIASHESDDAEDEMSDKKAEITTTEGLLASVEAFVTAHPELKEAVVTAFTSKYSLMTPDQMEKSIEAFKKNYAPVTVDDSFLESHGLVKKEALTTAVESAKTDAVKGLLTEAQVAEKVTAAVAEAVKPLNEKIVELEKPTQEAIANKKKADRTDAIKAAVENKDHIEFSIVLRSVLEAVSETVDLTADLITAKVTEAKTIWTAMGGKAKATGKAKPSGAQNTDTKEVTEAAKPSVHRSLAGME